MADDLITEENPVENKPYYSVYENSELRIVGESFDSSSIYLNVNFNFAEQVPDNGEKIKSVVCFAIAPENRGKGIATALLKYVCENAKNNGFEYVEAYSFEHNENAAYHGPTD